MQSVELQILLKALNTQSVTDLTTQLGNLNKASNQTSQGMSSLQAYMLPVLGGATALAAGFLAAANAGYQLVSAQGQLATETVKLSTRLDLSIEQTEKLQFAASIAGVNVGTFASAANKLTSALADSEKAGKKTVEALKALGVETKNVVGVQRDAGQVLLDTVDKLGRMEAGAKRTLLATKILGGDGAKELAPLIAQFGSLEEALKKAGITFDEALTRQLADADKQIKILDKSIELLKKQTAGKISPLIVPIIAEVTALVSGNKSGSQVAADAARGVGGLYASGAQKGFYSALADTALGLDSFLFGDYGSISPNVAAPGSEFAFAEAERRAAQLRRLNAPKAGPSKANPGDLRLFDLFARDATNNRRRVPSLFNTTEGFNQNILGLTPDGALRLDSRTFIDPNDGGDQGAAYGAGFLNRIRQDGERRKQDEREILSYRERMIELLAGPGGELAAAKQIRDLRIATAETEQEAAKANLDYQLRAAEIAANQRKEWRNTTGSIFDALVAGRSGITGFATGLLTSTGRTLFQNAGDLAYSGLKGRLSLPGQLGSNGQLSGFGKLLQGTAFGVDPLQFATDANTAATNANTQALLAASGIGGSTGIGGGITSALGLGAFLTGQSSTNPLAFGSAKGGSLGSSPIYNELGEIEGYIPNQKSSFATGVGYAGAIAGGAFGVYSGIKRGGVSGALTATGSAAGAASTILALAGVSGPAAPILGAAALGLSLAPLLFGDPKKKRDAAIGNEVDSRRFSDFTGTSYSTDVFGRSFDYNSRGDLRPIVVNVNTMDASGFIDRRDDISEAVRQAMSESHPIVKEMQSAIIPAQ